MRNKGLIIVLLLGFCLVGLGLAIEGQAITNTETPATVLLAAETGGGETGPGNGEELPEGADNPGVIEDEENEVPSLPPIPQDPGEKHEGEGGETTKL